MKLSTILQASPLRTRVKPGAGALIKRDLQLIDERERKKIGESLDLDGASRAEHPSKNRWDYLLSLPAAGRVVALEPHTARDSEVGVVIAKRAFALQYLRSHMPPRYRIAEWYWVCHGSVNFSNMDRARRQLDQQGITFVGRRLRKL
jgi:hypothetical protein